MFVLGEGFEEVGGFGFPAAFETKVFWDVGSTFQAFVRFRVRGGLVVVWLS